MVVIWRCLRLVQEVSGTVVVFSSVGVSSGNASAGRSEVP